MEPDRPRALSRTLRRSAANLVQPPAGILSGLPLISPILTVVHWKAAGLARTSPCSFGTPYFSMSSKAL